MIVSSAWWYEEEKLIERLREGILHRIGSEIPFEISDFILYLFFRHLI